MDLNNPGGNGQSPPDYSFQTAFTDAMAVPSAPEPVAPVQQAPIQQAPVQQVDPQLPLPSQPAEPQQPQYPPQPVAQPQPSPPAAQPQAAPVQPTPQSQYAPPQAPLPQVQPTPQPQYGQPPVPQPVAPQPPQSQPANELYQQAQQVGIDTAGMQSEYDVARALVERVQQLTPYAQVGQQVAPYYDDIRQYLADKQQPQAQPPVHPQAQPPADEWNVDNYFKDKWQSPQWDPSWDRLLQSGVIERDAAGMYKPIPGYEVTMGPVVNQLNEAVLGRTQATQQLFNGNFYRQVYDVLKEPLMREMRSEWQGDYEKEMSATQNVQQMQQWERDNSSWLHARDPSGQVTGYSPAGQQLAGEIQHLRQNFGVEDPNLLMYLGNRLAPQQQQQGQGHGPGQAAPYQPPHGPGQMAPPPSNQGPGQAAPAQPPAQQAPVQQQYAPQPPQQQQFTPQQQNLQQQESFLQRAMDSAQHAPQGSPPVAPSGQPVTVSESDLERMFVNDFSAAQSAAA